MHCKGHASLCTPSQCFCWSADRHTRALLPCIAGFMKRQGPAAVQVTWTQLRTYDPCSIHRISFVTCHIHLLNRSSTLRRNPAPCHRGRGCAPRVPAPEHCGRILQPQRLQAAPRRPGCFGQRLALQARQGGHELCCRGWRAGAARISREACQDLLHLGMGKRRAC